MWRDPKEFKRDAVRMTIVIAVLAVVLKFVDPYFEPSDSREKSIAKSMIEEASQWHFTSTQDQNVHSKNKHSATAAAYLHAARHILNDASLERISGIDIHELDASIKTVEKASSRDMFRQCPRLKSSTKMLNPPVDKKSAWLS